ncbi:hypothetical protein [Sandaracinobacteroides saxicola]|uniref:Uncharacterized protein n=1 Tax=Sandaracinobacteroides saxicola TaxID=2759707 RepID=A0A7G5IHX5_9SPHN|nr:hypothetical protein [Sandaracinobacteroides saxicola]QMW22967.1 hypothetical protein H3309_00165 [Sandaracinobacteroides saxicola]
MDAGGAAARVAAAVPPADRAVARAWLDPVPYAAGDPLGTTRVFAPAPGRLWLGWVDLEPDRNWSHRAFAVLVHEDGAVETATIDFPPALPAGRRWVSV